MNIPHLPSPSRGACSVWSAGAKAFTLVEMLVVLGLLAVLVALLSPSLVGAMESSRRAECLSNLKQMGAAIFSFAADHNGELPGDNGGDGLWPTPVWPYAYPGTAAPKLPSDKFPPELVGTIFCCPAAAKESPRIRDYGFNYQLGDGDSKTRDRIVTLSKASKHAVVGDTANSSSINVSNLKEMGVERARHGESKANVLYVDGHAETTELTEEILKNYNGVFWGRQSQAFRW